MPYRCAACRKYFSVRTGTVMESSRLPMRKWAFALYLCSTNLKGVSSMKLHRDLRITQKTAWFMLGRIREAWLDAADVVLDGTVEVDETYIGANMYTLKVAALTRVGSRTHAGTGSRTPRGPNENHQREP